MIERAKSAKALRKRKRRLAQGRARIGKGGELAMTAKRMWAHLGRDQSGMHIELKLCEIAMLIDKNLFPMSSGARE